MSINSYLIKLANAAMIRERERLTIKRSIANLQVRLKKHFGPQVANGFIFGSYSRGTILPRRMDPQSDIDYMVVFSDGGFKPQTYLDRLRRFAELNYQRSEIEQSNPTIVLSLNHIRFELVPATQSWFGGLQIPARASDFNDWQATNPRGFNDRLSAANQAHGNLIKPLVRIMKYWNAANGYPFESYGLEQKVVDHGFLFVNLFANRRLASYFYNFIQGMTSGLFMPKWKQDAITRAKKIVQQARDLERLGNSIMAEAHIQKLLPPIGGLF